MKSKYLLTLILIGVLPVAAVVGVYYWMAMNEAPVGPSRRVDTSALGATVQAVQTTNQTIAASVKAGIEKTYQDFPKLVANHTDRDLDNFVHSHPGLAGVALFNINGKPLQTIPSTAQLADPAYGGSDEFKNMLSKFEKNGGQSYLFYSLRLSYPSFVFAEKLNPTTVVQAVLNLAGFFQNNGIKGGDIGLIDAESGQYFYDSNPAKMQSTFNPSQETWLSKVQESLKAGQTGSTISDDSAQDAVYTPLGLKSFGIVHVVPMSMLQGSSHPSPAPTNAFIEGLPANLQTPTSIYVLIAATGCIGWIFLVGSICYGLIISPVKRAGNTVMNAVNGRSNLTPEIAKGFGNNEVGRMVQAAAALMKKAEDDRKKGEQELEEAMKKGRAELDAKTRSANDQVASAQQQANQARNDANEKNQLLGDKLKELDALKAMSEGLRNQVEQAKAETGRLKSQVTTAEDAKNALQAKASQAQSHLEDQLREMEGKLLNAVAASSAIQVSGVRAAAIRTMAEELKTTLGIIKGYVSSALGTTQGGISEKQQEFLGMVINRSARLEKFINDLLDIYQVEIEQAGATYEEVNLAPEIEGLAFNFQAQADVKNIKIKTEAKGTVPKVPIVRRRFNQLWNILYLQIIKDAPRGSNIPITVEPIGDTVKVTVQDPGLTVAPEALPRLFDEFYDPKHPASPQLAGTGLKFALIKTILAAHGGGAVAEKADPGTRLVLTFATKVKKPGEAPAPVLTPRPAATAPTSAAAPSAAPKPGLTPTPGLGPKPAAPSFGLPKPAGSTPLGAPGATGTPATPAAASKPGLLDSLISKVPPVTAPGLRPSPGVAPAAGAPPAPATPGLTPPPGLKPPLPVPGMPASPAAPSAAPPGLSGGLLESLLDKKTPVPAAGGPIMPPSVAPSPSIPSASKPPAPPGVGAAPGIPAAPKPPIPIPGMAAPPVPGIPKPPVPGAPSVGAPPMAPRPAAAPPPGMGGPGAPVVPKPPIPGIPAPGVPGAPSAASKVVPTSLKPTVPPPGIIDLDNADGMKLDVGAPKPPTAAPVPKPMPGAPLPPPGAPKPPAPGVPPGGLDASKAQKGKETEGDLID